MVNKALKYISKQGAKESKYTKEDVSVWIIEMDKRNP
jgi:hypothetical protein